MGLLIGTTFAPPAEAVDADDLVMYYGDGRGGWKGVETIGWGWNIFNGLH
ncbi:hypothetical protein StoSoilA2_40840 [Arthrobacter sp. StoSoilA2]|nr:MULTISPECIES: hypothetical protein [unclassified Arthrobacter]MDR6686244.1 hypothetical protein [Arthrobacter sp. 1088]BCW38028.1 hypothetical protein StoSoilA2_40840 [Arthrobacter sp. StoSoilA2]